MSRFTFWKWLNNTQTMLCYSVQQISFTRTRSYTHRYTRTDIPHSLLLGLSEIYFLSLSLSLSVGYLIMALVCSLRLDSHIKLLFLFSVLCPTSPEIVLTWCVYTHVSHGLWEKNIYEKRRGEMHMKIHGICLNTNHLVAGRSVNASGWSAGLNDCGEGPVSAPTNDSKYTCKEGQHIQVY